MKHVLLNPERYRLPDYPFIEKSERGCLSAGVGTVDRGGGAEENGFHLNNIRFFYQGNQCYFLMKNNGSPEGENDPLYYSTNVDFYIGDPNYSYSPLKDAYFSAFSDRNDYLENPIKVPDSYKEYEHNGVAITSEELWSNRNNQYELMVCGFGSLYIALIQIEKNKISGTIDIERIISNLGYRELFIKPYIESTFETIDLTPLLNDHRVTIHYNSYTYNCGCLDLDINRFE